MKTNKTVKIVIMIFICIIWCTCFMGTISFESTFAAISLLSVVCVYYAEKSEIRLCRFENLAYILLGVVTSVFFTLNDYSLFVNSKHLNMIKGGIAFICGSIIISCIYAVMGELLSDEKIRAIFIDEKSNVKRSPMLICAFFLPVIVDSVYLWGCCYPGWINMDLRLQIEEMMTGIYENHHPYWHTKTMEMIIKPIFRISGDGNLAVSMFCIFQIVVMSLCFTYLISTLQYVGVRRNILYLVIIVNALMPYNIGMSCALEKDTLWSVAVGVYFVSLYRVLFLKDSKKKLDVALAVIGLMGVCLYRTNGIIVIGVSLVCLIVREIKHKNGFSRIIIILVTFFLSSLCLNNLYIEYKGIEQPDIVEALSIPLQQIARTIDDQKELSEQEVDFISKIIDYERIDEIYDSASSDNIKNEIREHGNQQYISDHKLEFIKVWISVGIKYPFNYLKGWIDETRGYWCPSFYYSVWDSGVSERVDLSQYNIRNVERNRYILSAWNKWNAFISHNEYFFTEIILACGLRFWLLVFLLIWAIKNRRPETVLYIIPITIIATLMVASPTCHTFRYVYAVFYIWPICIYGLFNPVTGETKSVLESK